MRRVALYLVLGIIFGFISYFLVQELSPFNSSKIDELIQVKEIEDGDFEKLKGEIVELVNRGLIISYLSENAYVVVFCILLSIFCIFVSIHLIIDKIFFKNFYEDASHFDAIRRGGLVVISLTLFIFSKLSKAETYVLVLVVIIPFLVEIIYIMYFKKKEVNPENLKEASKVETIEGKHISFEEAFQDLERFNPPTRKTKGKNTLE